MFVRTLYVVPKQICQNRGNVEQGSTQTEFSTDIFVCVPVLVDSCIRFAEQLVQDFNAVPNLPHTSQMELAEVIHPATGRLSVRRLLDSRTSV